MTTFTRDSDGIPRCQFIIDGSPCNGAMLLTPDNHYLVCHYGHGKLIPIRSDEANLVRQAYRDRDNPSQALLNRRWKEALPVAVKIGTFTRTAYDRDKQSDVKERIAVYKVAETMYETTCPATQLTGTVGRNVVACVVSKSKVRSAKLFAPLSLTEEQISKLQKKAK